MQRTTLLFPFATLLLAAHAPCLAGVVHAVPPPFRGQPDTGFAGWETFTQGLDAANVPDDGATSLPSAALRQLWANGYVDGMGNLASFDLLAVRVEDDSSGGDLQEVVLQLALLGTDVLPSSFVLVDEAGHAFAPSEQVPLFDDGLRRERSVRFDVSASRAVLGAFHVDFVTTLSGGGALDALTLDTRRAPPVIEVFCSGDTTSACPCAPGAAGHGCPSAANANGALLRALGAPGDPGFALRVEGLDPARRPTVLLVRAANATAPFANGDGIACLAAPVGDGAGFAEAGALTLVPSRPATPGAVHYQALYRSAPLAFCDPFAAYNATNGLIVRWP